MQKIDLSICIVAYKANSQLKSCLSAIDSSKITSTYEIIIVDNNEHDSIVPQIVKKYSKVRYIKSPKNGGYGAGNNLAVFNAQGEYVLVLNPDVTFDKNTINKLYRFLKTHKDAAAVGPAYQRTNQSNVPLGTGELTPLTGIFALSFLNKLLPSNRFSKSYYLSDDVRKKATQVWSVAGSIAMFRKQALLDAGGYDEKLFLYFEENDLGRRLKKLGWELWIINDDSVSHLVGKSTENLEKKDLKNIFIQSRRHYFQKHFGYLNALLVECFALFGKFEAILLLILGVGAFLRFFMVSQNMVFHGELGDNYLAMKNIFMTGVIPLLGPPTSHPWLAFGPLFYWVFAPLLLLVRYNPIGIAYVFALLHTILIALNYWTIKELFDKRSALISSFLIAISPAYVSFAHESRFFSLTLLLFYPFFYCLLKKKYLLSGLFFAILLNFHLTPLVYIPAVIFFLYRQKAVFRSVLQNFSKGTIVGSAPFILYNVFNRFVMIKNAAIWIPYRIGGFLGLVPKNNVDATVIQANVGSGYQFIKYAFLPSTFPEALSIITVVVIIICAIYGLSKWSLKGMSHIVFLIILLVIGYIAIFIHGQPPTHYYLPLYPVFIVLVSLGLSRFGKGIVLLLAALFLVNTSFYFSNNWFYKNQMEVNAAAPVPYSLQLKAVQAIIFDSQGKDFSLSRVGPFDQFSENYSQNYRYLLWYKGNEPIQNSSTIYTIYETNEVPQTEKIIFSEGGLTVTKKYEIDVIIT